MDITSLIIIVVVIVAIYFVIKFIVSPLIKAVTGVIIFLIALYVLQKYFGFDFNKVLSPLGINLNIDMSWMAVPVDFILVKIYGLFKFILGIMPNVTKK